jgi:hypothetical protein
MQLRLGYGLEPQEQLVPKVGIILFSGIAGSAVDNTSDEGTATVPVRTTDAAALLADAPRVATLIDLQPDATAPGNTKPIAPETATDVTFTH